MTLESQVLVEVFAEVDADDSGRSVKELSNAMGSMGFEVDISDAERTLKTVSGEIPLLGSSSSWKMEATCMFKEHEWSKYAGDQVIPAPQREEGASLGARSRTCLSTTW